MFSLHIYIMSLCIYKRVNPHLRVMLLQLCNLRKEAIGLTMSFFAVGDGMNPDARPSNACPASSSEGDVRIGSARLQCG
jgi:hypothetical protein